jgi:hypothetical protein
MSKRIVVCANGTWDEPGKNTNVYKLYKALKVSADQISHYDDGVGSDRSEVRTGHKARVVERRVALSEEPICTRRFHDFRERVYPMRARQLIPPGNLQFSGGQLAPRYSKALVISQAAMAAARQ